MNLVFVVFGIIIFTDIRKHVVNFQLVTLHCSTGSEVGSSTPTTLYYVIPKSMTTTGGTRVMSKESMVLTSSKQGLMTSGGGTNSKPFSNPQQVVLLTNGNLVQKFIKCYTNLKLKINLQTFPKGLCHKTILSGHVTFTGCM